MSNETSADAQLIGAVTGGYRVLAQIGTGTMGHVYDAEDVKSGKHVALKVLRKSHQKDLTARFLREGKTLALLSHPHIVQLVDMGELDDGTLFLATELVSGGSLRDVMDRGPIEHRRALRLVRQLLDALQAAHDLGVVHRDIKPENVMVADGDYVKVLDFGVAKLLQDTIAGLGEANLTSVGFSVFGSALYIAPESVTGQKVDARIDIYSTGAMLFEMVANQPPFNHEDPTELLRAHAFEAPPTLQQAAPTQTFAPELEALIARALAKKPEDRFGSAADMMVAVDAALEALEPKAVAPPPPVVVVPVADRRVAEPRQVARRTPSRTLVIAGIGAVLLAAMIGVAIHSRSSAASSSAMSSSATPVAGSMKPDDAAALLEQGHAQYAQHKIRAALADYERVLRGAPSLAGDAKLRSNLAKTLDSKDVLATILALDLLASLTPPAYDPIIAYASSGKLEAARHRAVMIAERDGVAAKIDRVQSSILDLDQASSCEDRKATIEQLASSSDRRALAALKRARTVTCVEQDAANAIARIEAAAK